MLPLALTLGTCAIRMLMVPPDSEQYPDNFAAIKSSGIKHIETVAIYPIQAQGEAEKWIGDGEYVENDFKIDTKVFYSDLALGGKGLLNCDAVEKSLDRSLEKLKVEKVGCNFVAGLMTSGGLEFTAAMQVNALYIHGPDYETPFIEQAAAFDAQYRAGKFVALGISNCKPGYVFDYLDVAIENNYVRPTVYSGQYNVLCHGWETERFPHLRKHKMSFAGYSPLAGGFLTEKLTFSKSDQDLRGTRFENDASNYMGAGYKHWYDHPEMHDAVKKMEGYCKESGVDMADAAWRLLIGPSTIGQLEEYTKGVEIGPLPVELVEKLDGLWEDVKDVAANVLVY